ncbi:hypothetical protein BKA70DRAFT_1239254 [Coprinopsis sp. MPI-PUGE-AT-0042]|nr:hypothetical protein BKA70DRAFT_1239254 [Coprinopsis sp. MPI-PUGE-AT-0042]
MHQLYHQVPAQSTKERFQPRLPFQESSHNDNHLSTQPAALPSQTIPGQLVVDPGTTDDDLDVVQEAEDELCIASEQNSPEYGEVANFILDDDEEFIEEETDNTYEQERLFDWFLPTAHAFRFLFAQQFNKRWLTIRWLPPSSSIGHIHNRSALHVTWHHWIAFAVPPVLLIDDPSATQVADQARMASDRPMDNNIRHLCKSQLVRFQVTTLTRQMEAAVQLAPALLHTVPAKAPQDIEKVPESPKTCQPNSGPNSDDLSTDSAPEVQQRYGTVAVANWKRNKALQAAPRKKPRPDSAQTRKEYRVYRQLLDMIPDLEELLSNLEIDIDYIADEIQEGMNNARSDDTKGLKTAIIDWITEGKPHESSLRRNAKAGRGYQSKITGRLLCPVGVDWDDIEEKEALWNHELVVTGTQWLHCMYKDETCDFEDPWKGLLRNELLVKTYKVLEFAQKLTSEVPMECS